MTMMTLGLLALTACEDKGTDTGDTHDEHTGGHDTDTDTDTPVDTDTGTAPVAVAITTAGGDCDKKGWFYDIYTTGMSNGGDLWIYQTGSTSPWEEDHPLPVYTSSDTESNLYLELTYVASTADVVSGSTTLFGCDTARQDSLTWLVYVYDSADEYADCVTWGHDTSFFAKECKNAL